MNRGMYRKLALQNIKNNKNTFLPFSVSCIAMIGMFYMLHSIQMQADDNLFYGAHTMQMILSFGTIVCGIFSLFVVFYTNSFLMKRRSKEFGLYSILGMEKKHIAKVVFWEIAMVGSGCIAVGLLMGMVLSKLMFLILLNILHLRTDFAFKVMPQSVGITFVVFAGVFFMIMFVNTIRVFRLKPIELMRGSRAGEREPKAKWFMAILGVVCLGVGYYLALSTKNPLEAMGTFFVAVLFVIAGTYLLFMSGSIVLLKLLKKNKNYYYHKNHFITVSGMMYRMKQNAVGLANICILSTAVLVVLSTTISLYVGIDDVLRTRYEKDVITEYLYEKGMDSDEYTRHYDYAILEKAVYERAQAYEVEIKDLEQYFEYYCTGTLEGNQFTPEYNGIDSMTLLDIITLDVYNEMTGKQESLQDHQILLSTTNEDMANMDTICIGTLEYTIAKTVEDAFAAGDAEYYSMAYLIVPEFEMMETIRDEINSMINDGSYTSISYNFNFDLDGKLENKEAFCQGLRDVINDTGIAHTSTVENIYTVRPEFYGIYGSLFFIGIFIGTLFLITTVMIIYYKQISEGYDDRDRFVIMQKVGMTGQEVKSVIKNQILLVFFLPILLAVVHICFAFDIIKKILVLLNLTNVTLFVICTIITVAVFFIVYGIVYGLTAKAYYHITYQR